jgi:hypothetical protein
VIGPALTPEQWATFPDWGREVVPPEITLEEYPLYFPSKHGIAAVNLHEQPFGFTRGDVAVLRDIAIAGRSMGFSGAASSLADRIEALLPPEGS